MSTAGLVVIGDEILSGKTADTNTPFLIGELRSLGVALREVAIISDQVQDIAATICRFAARYDHVFTSGGVGPTHDDLTIAGVAQAFSAPVERHPLLERLLRAHYAERDQPLVARNLRMADVPAGAVLITGADLKWPVLAMHNVYILPGIPEIFQRKFRAIRERFREPPFHLRQIFIDSDEGSIARHLDQIAAGHGDVAIGSYPLLAPAPDGHRVKVTLEGKDAAAVECACQALLQLLDPAHIVRCA